MGGVAFLGLDYQAVERCFALEPPADPKDAWWALRVLESEALKLRNDDADKR